MSRQLFGYLARCLGNRANHRTVPQGKSRHAISVQAVGARMRRRQNGQTMNDHLSPADAALRERITELSVHIACGTIRGPRQRRSRYYPDLPIRWQSCNCEDAPQPWEGCDVSREKDLCIVCFRGTAGGVSRWAWLACEHCRNVNDAIARLTGVRPLALGRHSLINGIGIRGGSTPEEHDAQLKRLVTFAAGDGRLRDWCEREYRRLASAFAPAADVALRDWQQRWPPGRAASIDVFERLLEVELPLRR